MSAIAYPVGENLYLNITNRCTNSCPFCIRYKSREFNQEHPLWLDHEPTVEELIAEIGDPSKYKQIVFCGYGEPTIRLDIVKDVGRKLKAPRLRSGQADSRAQNTGIRIDTNGHGNLFWGRNILPELKGLIDSMSISLNAQNAEVYEKLCHSSFGPKTYAAVLDFIREAKKVIPEVEVSIVDLPTVDKKACQQIAAELGVKFRLRPYYEVQYVR